MSDVKQVKVDNWGIYFLQRLKHFFNRTDYCDLTLQFQDNAQLKVHRLVLNACTEYFELLERTCEMYEDCLVMPDDLQADVVVPIINFMYTGQLEFRMDALEKLYQTSLVMNMPVLTKLLEAHRSIHVKVGSSHNYSGIKKSGKSSDTLKTSKYSSNLSSLGKRSYNKAFENQKSYQNIVESNKPIVSNKTIETAKNKLQNNNKIIYKEKKYSIPKNKPDNSGNNDHAYRPPSPIPLDTELYSKKFVLGDPRPTRYELPEELDTDNIFENSFTKLSYTSKPLMVHPETSKQYSKRANLFTSSGSKKGMKSTVDIVECKKVSKGDSLFEDSCLQAGPDEDMFQSAYLSVRESHRDPNQLFDQVLDNNDSPKVTIEGKDKQIVNLDHAKIISEVLKKYPHLVKGNKNIKLKILNTSAKRKKSPALEDKLEEKTENETSYAFETDVLNSKEAAKLIAMGAENIKGPWICLICGTPGRALNFTSYYNFRRHLVEVHNEKPVSTICEYCGLRSMKRNYLLHHIYTKHGVPPPPQYHFPKCNMCDYVALTEAFLIKHKLTHNDSKPVRCYVCSVGFSTVSQLLMHIQKTGHKHGKDKKQNLQCVYCMKVFLRESNFYVHLKTSHREMAIRDGIIEDSDEERPIEVKPKIIQEMKSNIKYEQSFENEYEDTDIQYQVQQKIDTNSHVKKPRLSMPKTKHKILNPGFSSGSPSKSPIKPKVAPTINNDYSDEIDVPSPQAQEENIVLIDGDEYIMKENQLIPKKSSVNTEYIISDLMDSETNPKLTNLEASITPTTSIEFANLENTDTSIKKATNISQPIQIVVSNEEEYKALISTNHSIIFDDGDTNKTLTVLTAPHTNTIENTAMELQNTQPGDMMIIQQDYPLNVSETVSAVSADSKYVVVYSHAVGHEDNKQYQIITPQEIDAQFVQASDVITQNFETVTTTTSVLNNHVIEEHIEETWPEQATDVQTMHSHMDSENKNGECDKINENIQQTVHDPNTSIVELPEIQLSTENEVVQDNLPITHNTIDPNSMDIQDNLNNTNQVIIANNTTESMDVDVSTITDKENVSEQQVVDQIHIDEVSQTSVACQDEHSLNQDESLSLEEPHVTQKVVEETNDIHEHTEPEATINTNDVTNINEEVSNDTEEVPMEEFNTNNEVDTTVSETVSIPKVTVQIQNIASEWSEDEYDVAEGPTEEVRIPEAEAQVPAEESEVEESIENIQQEMRKQLSNVVEVPMIEESIATKEAHLANHEEPETCNKNEEGPSEIVVTSRVKITSLLNDWEDNDSQEENMATIQNENQTSTISVIQATNDLTPNNNTVINEPKEVELKKDDKIKSLVSDWDDEEEETKE